MNQLTNKNFHSRSALAGRQGAFTLVEVMISVALVLLIIYGVSKVFKLSTDTIGAQQALATIVRDHRSFQDTLGQDFKNVVADSPVFIISSRIGYMGVGGGLKSGFKNADEERNNGQLDPNPTHIYVDGSSVGNVPQFSMSDRVPRLDRLSFFTRGLFRRQTANDNEAFTPTTANEAYVWYGHTALPLPTAGTFKAPFDQYASERILGRAAYLFRDGATLAAGEKRMGGSGGLLAPLDYASGNYDIQVGGDVAPLSMDAWRQSADTAFFNDPNNWFRPLEDSNGKSFRVWCDPKTPRPITSRGMARSVPYFVGNCTQFVVEYAGDFIAQKYDGTYAKAQGDGSGIASMVDPNTGAVVKGLTDGAIDFVVDSVTGAHKIRWYGLYRDVNGDGVIDARDDVVPLADVLQLKDTTKYGCGVKDARAPWEATLPVIDPINNKFAYTCAWHNDSPLLIRVSMKIGDPTNRLQDGQWYEYVFAR